MTKSARKKKEKAADFTKRKLKLGKGKQLASNAVDTSFKARSIVIPQQSITVTNEATALTTKRKLTLDALLTHLKHYGAGVRKDALQGLRELLNDHPTLIEQNLSKLVNGCVRLISDEDASVRKALYSFFAWLLPRVPLDHLLPYASILLLFLSSAQSHIFLEIRLDAIRLLDLLFEHIPDQVVAGFWNEYSGGSRIGHGRKLLDGYLGLLNVSARFNESPELSSGLSVSSMPLASLSSSAKATVLKSFSRFLYHAIEQQSSPDLETKDEHHHGLPIPLWYFSEAFTSKEAFASFSNTLLVKRANRQIQDEMRTWSGRAENEFIGTTSFSDIFGNYVLEKKPLDLEGLLDEIDHLGHEDNSFDGLNHSKGLMLVSLCRALHPVLVSTFLDCAPLVFSPTQRGCETQLVLVHALMEIARCTYGRLLRESGISAVQTESARKDLDALVVYMSPHFPFGENRMFASDIESEGAFQQMNLIYCELFSLRSINRHLGFQGDDQGPAAKRRKLNHKPTRKSAMTDFGSARQAERVRGYVVRRLRGTGMSTNALSHPLGESLTAQTYVGLLPTLWWLLDQEDEEASTEVLEAVLGHATSADSKSSVKPVAVEFVGRLVLLQDEPSYEGSFRVGPFMSQKSEKALRDWVENLPRVVWEIGDKNLVASELILLLLIRLLLRRAWPIDIMTSISLCTRFATFFIIRHPTRGELVGPYSRLDIKFTESSEPKSLVGTPSALKRLALDVAATLVSTKVEAPRKTSLEPGRRAGYVSHPGTGLGNDPGTVMGVLVNLQAALRGAVSKAVSGTTEELYWLGVSQV